MGGCGSKTNTGKVANDPSGSSSGISIRSQQSSARISAAIIKKQQVYDELLIKNNVDASKTEMFQKSLHLLESLATGERDHKNISHMTKKELKDIFRDIEQENFEHVYQLFSDAFKQQKRVDPKEFVLTMSLLACPITDKSTECVLIFTIFDPDGSGTLDREEFSRLMKATIMSKLTHVEFLMKNDKAKQLMEKHMASEYTEENGQFYTAVVEWKKHEFPTLEMTEEIVNKFVRVGSELQVNISSSMSDKVVKALEEAKASGKVPKDIFDEAHKEIYKIIDKDSFSRFKKNDGEIQELCDALFAQCDKDGSGQVTLDEYKAWVKSNPDAMNFLRDLNNASDQAVEQVRSSVYFKRLSVMDGGLNGAKMEQLRKKYSRKLLVAAEDDDNEEDEEDEEDE
mmetsp:Transcript_16744/g.33408  ORF Transcript_16744/g.33408 Transcript_16744/m.33408 type:complete len:398 (+) Transcript_16744:95-1288(+)